MTHQREHWGSRIGFILAAAGSAIGLGSLWKFPYVTGQNGGGAFVLIYLLSTVFICIPLFIGELVMGRASQKSPVGAFSNLSHHSQNWKGVGWLAVTSTVIVLSYYIVVAGWTLNYVFLSLSQFTQGRSSEEIVGVFDVMVKSPGVNVLWQALFLIITAGVLYNGVQKGIEHWSKILMPVLLVILLGLFLFSITLPGFGEAFRFVLYPDFSKITPSGILTALGLAFFTATLGFGVILTYGSYLDEGANIPKTSVIVLLVTVGISLVAALMIFPIIFSFGFAPAEGAGLVFKTLPVLFAKLPGTLLISTTFFLLLVFTALTSTVSLLENLVATFMEVWEWNRHRAIYFATGLVFVVGLPSALAGSGLMFPTWSEMYGGDFFATISSTWDRWFLPLTGLLTSIFLGWRVDHKMRNAEFLQGTNWRWALKPWVFFLRWVIPIAIGIFMLEATGIIDFDKVFA